MFHDHLEHETTRLTPTPFSDQQPMVYQKFPSSKAKLGYTPIFIHFQTHPNWWAHGLLHKSNAGIGLLRNQINGLLVENLGQLSRQSGCESKHPKIGGLKGNVLNSYPLGKVIPTSFKIQDFVDVPFLRQFSFHDFIVRIFHKPSPGNALMVGRQLDRCHGLQDPKFLAVSGPPS